MALTQKFINICFLFFLLYWIVSQDTAVNLNPMKFPFFQIEVGATTVRVGSVIFGARPPKSEWNKQ